MATVLGLRPRTALIVGGVAVAGGVVYFWWRGRQNAAAPAASATGCTDGSGNAVPCPDASGIDTSGQLSVIQTELESLLAGEGKEPAAAAGGGEHGKPLPGNPAKAAVPNVVGDNWGKADNAIRHAGLTPKVAGASTLKGINTRRVVTKQSPAPGTMLRIPGGVVTVTLSPVRRMKAGAPSGGGGSGGESESDSGSG